MEKQKLKFCKRLSLKVILMKLMYQTIIITDETILVDKTKTLLSVHKKKKKKKKNVFQHENTCAMIKTNLNNRCFYNRKWQKSEIYTSNLPHS